MTIYATTDLINAMFGYLMPTLTPPEFYALQIWTGPLPDSADDAPTGTLLFETGVGSEWGTPDIEPLRIELNTPVIDDTVAAGEAAFFRIGVDQSGSFTTKFMGTITETGGGGAIEFNETDWPNEEEITIESFTLFLPPNETS